MITLNANATEMCARNDTVVIPLDATVTKNGWEFNTTEWLWWLKFSYGTIYGSGTCLSLKEIQEIQNDFTLTKPSGFLNTSTDELVGLSGYYMNADINPDIPDSEKPAYVRKYCYRKVIHPMHSAWMLSVSFGQPYQSGSYGCSPNCIDLIMDVANGSTVATRGMTDWFNSIGTIPPWSE